MVLDHLKGVGPITPLDALKKYGIMRLGARVWDLRKEGVPIKTDIITVKTRSGEARVARYSL